ncbi:MAG: 2-deoxyribose-5-phosphate aldolase, partial [Synergistota bacterium]|nr:2-deoxyribose-5-phosphate aldolase [Synergistota bacterium]
MDSLRDLCRTIDNTLLRQDVSVVEVEEFISRSVEARFRTVVVPPWMVAHAVSMTENSETGVSVVVGFPLGY